MLMTIATLTALFESFIGAGIEILQSFTTLLL